MDEEQKLTAEAVLRRARPGDEAGILECIRALATYEREPETVETTADALRQSLFGPSPSVFAHVIARQERIVGIAVWFLNYSTWTGRAASTSRTCSCTHERASATARRCFGHWRSSAPARLPTLSGRPRQGPARDWLDRSEGGGSAASGWPSGPSSA